MPDFVRPTGGSPDQPMITGPAVGGVGETITVRYERNIPTTVEEAIHELDKRVMTIAQQTGGQVDVRHVVAELLEDFQQGFTNRSNIIIPNITLAKR